MAAIGAPFRRACSEPAQLPSLDSPGGQFRHVVDLDLRTHSLVHEGNDIGSRDPRRAETRSNIRRPEIGRLDLDQCPHIALEHRIEGSGGFSSLKFVAYLAGEIGVRRLPCACFWITEDRIAQIGNDGIHVSVKQLGDVIDVDMAALVEDDRERIGGVRNDRRRRR